MDNFKFRVIFVMLGLVVAPLGASAQILPFVEDFDDTLSRDAAETTADWDTGDPGGEFAGDDLGALKLPVSTSAAPIDNLIDPLTGAGAASTDIDTQGEDTRAAVLEDLDGDGDLDIAFGSNRRVDNNDPTVQVFLNNGAGGFSESIGAIPGAHTFNSGGLTNTANTRDGAAADLNGDGYLDLVFTHNRPNRADQVHLNNPAAPGTFNITVNLTPLAGGGDRSDVVAIGDVDGDNDNDIVIGGDGSLLKLYLNDGFGTFSDPIDVDPLLIGFVRSVLLADIDHNGDLDLVVTLETRNQRVYINNGNGDFDTVPAVQVGAANENNLASPQSASLADTDGDGDLDLLVGNDGINRFYANTSTPGSISFAAGEDFGTDNFKTNTMLPIDIDRDGDLDIVTAELALAPGDVAEDNLLYINDGTGSFPATGTIFSGPDRSKSIVAGDVNADGKPDLIIATDDNNQRFLNVGLATLTASDQLIATARSADVLLVGNAPPLFASLTDNRPMAERGYRVWVTDSGTTDWQLVEPGVSIDPGTGGDLRFRVDFRTLRDFASQPEISILELRVNNDPTLDDETTNTDEDALFTLDLTAAGGMAKDAGDTYRVEVEGASTLPAWLTLSTDFQGTYTLSGTPTNDDVGLISFDLEVFDGGGASVTATMDITVDNTDDDPTLDTPILDQNATDGVAFSVDISGNFSDPDAGDTLSFSESGLPASGNLTLDMNTGIISGTPDDPDVAECPCTVTITATDDDGGADASDDFQLSVADANDDPVLDTSIPDDNATEGEAYNRDISGFFSDPDAGDTLTFGASGLPASGNLTINSSTGVISGTPLNLDVGVYSVTITADDGNGGTPAQDTWQLTVTNVDSDPTSTPIADQNATDDVFFSLDVSGNFSDADVGDSLTYSAAGLPVSGNLTIDTNTGIISGTPRDADVGASTVTVSASDGGGTPAQESFTLTISDANDDPVLATPIANATESEGVAVSIDISGNFSDADAGDTLTFSASGLPASGNLSIDAASGVISGVPLDADTGVFSVTITADDGNGGTPAQDSFNLTINDVNNAPVVTSTAITGAQETVEYTYTVTVSDDDAADTITISETLVPDWLALGPTIDNGDGTFMAILTGTPEGGDVGPTNPVDLTISDGTVSIMESFNISVAAAGEAPVITLLGDNPLVLSLAQEYEEPGWTATDAQDGVLTDQVVVTGSVDTLVAGDYILTYTVTDTAGNSTSVERTVTVRGGGGGSSATGPISLAVLALSALLMRRRSASVRLNDALKSPG